ncbi:MAG: amidohydrolase family protein [Nitrospiraceae bacterium]
MKRVVVLVVGVIWLGLGGQPLLFSQAVAGSSNEAAPIAYAFVNGRWFDGRGFQRATWYAVEGRFTQRPPVGVVETVDLAGAFIVPPFGEAHNHNVEGEWDLDSVAARYLRDGIFYVKIPNNVRDFALRSRGRLNRPSTIDVAFAHAGITGIGGHPIGLYEDILRVSRYEPEVGPLERGWFQNRAYVQVETPQEADEKWPIVLSGEPEFIKAYLAHAEAVVTGGLRATKEERRGLNPDLLPVIVGKAHASGKRVTVHVETANDFRLAVQAEADEIAHLPGWIVGNAEDVALARLTEDDARSAARRGVTVVTTTVAAEGMPVTAMPHQHGHTAHPNRSGPVEERAGGDRTLHAEARKVQRENLHLLHRHGVRLVIGSDHADTSLAEINHLRSFGLFDNLTLLKMWCEATPAAIFPDRKIGRFEEGYEASLLALADDPLDDFEAVQGIRLRVKQGHLLQDSSWTKPDERKR